MRRYAVLLLLPLLALVPVSPARGQVAKGIFAIDCFYTHSAQDDPIVFPGQSGASHLHDFYGNINSSANSTETSMRGSATKCRDLEDGAGYWNPAGYMPSGRLLPSRIAAYYVNDLEGSVEPFPQGLQMVGGNSVAAPEGGASAVFWFCGLASSPFRSHPYNCSGYPGGDVTGRVDFPTCWDGNGISRDDMAYASSFPDGACPSDWHTLPRLSYRVHFDILDPCDGAVPCGPNDPDTNVKLMLSSGTAVTGVAPGPYTTLHADFWNTWNQGALNDHVQACDNAHVDCGKIQSTPTVPGPPNLSAAPGTGAVSLSWTPGPNGGSDVFGYNIYRSTASATELDTTAPPPRPINSSPVASTSYADTDVTPGVTYSYRIAAVNAIGEGRPSNEASATPQPPTNATAPAAPVLSATAGAGLVDLTWTAPSDGGSAITGYNVYRGAMSGGERLLATVGTVTSYRDDAVANGTTYYYTVSAVNAVGEGPDSNEVSAAPHGPTVPGPPHLSARTASTRGVRLSWSVPDNGGSRITGYRIWRSTSPNSKKVIFQVGAYTRTYLDTRTKSGATYYYRVRAVNAVGPGEFSNKVHARAR